ncbi:MAG: hypothetical protein NPIRA05_15860 [Nitrospirales bacterium]|nr:MAG: hypothetical protein NPIRA05_15860 [Nitrospirales bacterium]
MKTRIWLMAPLLLGVVFGCTEKQLGQISHLVNAHVAEKQPGERSNIENAQDVTQRTPTTFSSSVAQEIAALDDYVSTMQHSKHTSGKSLDRKDLKTLKSAKAVLQEGKALQKKGTSYRALQKIRAAKKMMNPMMKKLWRISDKRAILGIVNQQIDIVKQRHQELEYMIDPKKTNSKKVSKAHRRSKVLFDEADKLRKNGKLRRAYVQSEEALRVLDTVIAVVWRDHMS